METISTSQLRTKSSDLIKTLTNGGHVSLIHRSRKVGVIVPTADLSSPIHPLANVAELKKIIGNHSKLRLLSQNQREKNYAKHLLSKYG